MTTFVKLYVQGESSKMPVVYDRFGTNGLIEDISKFFFLEKILIDFKCQYSAPDSHTLIL